MDADGQDAGPVLADHDDDHHHSSAHPDPRHRSVDDDEYDDDEHYDDEHDDDKKKENTRHYDSTADVESKVEQLTLNENEYMSLSMRVIDAYFGARKGQQLVKHQLDSYNDFILRKLEQIIDGFNPVDVYNSYIPEHGCYKYVMSVCIMNPTISKPVIQEKDGSTKVMLPNDARLRNLTYAAPLSVDIVLNAKTYVPEMKSYSVETNKISGVSLGKIPVMVRSRYCMLSQQQTPSPSDECRYDYGGYFIVNGNEKVVISQDRIAENRTYVFTNTKATGYSYVAEVRSVQESRFGVPKITTLKLATKANQFGRCIRVTLHHVRVDVPLFVVFRALGVVSDKDIVRYIVHDSSKHADIQDELAACMHEACEFRTRDDALSFLMQQMQPHGPGREASVNHRLAILNNVLRKDFLPHVGPDPLKKALYLGSMTSKLLRCYLGLRPLDDRDSYINKRLDTPGVLFANLFRQNYGKVIKDMRTQTQKEINGGSWRATNKFVNVINKTNVFKIVKQQTIEQGLRTGLSTGNWGLKSSANRPRVGVAQVVNRMNYNGTLSHLRRVNTPIEKTGKLVQPRKLHCTQMGIICPSETPEGASVGLVKNLALLTNITIATPSDAVRAALDGLGVIEPTRENIEAFADVNNVMVIVNGDIVGTHDKPDKLYSELKRLKMSGALSVFTSIVWNVLQDEILICTEGGRFSRPLLVVSKESRGLAMTREQASGILAGTVDWQDLVLSGAVEYLDVEESNAALIAMTYADLLDHKDRRYSHIEISPSAMLGVVAGSIPYSDHNQAPRNTYQSAMGKQAIGVYATNFRHRFDTMAHVLSYPQKPLVSTKTARILNCDELPCGVNVVVAIACFTGFNQEDSVIVNKSAVDRGLFVSTFFRTFREQNNKNHSTGEEEFFCKPDPLTTRNIKPHNYGKLQTCGFVNESTYVESGDVIIGKCMPQKQGTAIINKDTSVALKSNERGFVDKNCFGDRYFTNTTGDGYTFAKVRLRNERVPTIGDKVSSRHGQKGTIGMMYHEDDMPFTVGGIIPSLIMNPHAIPSRMTIGQLMEAIQSKACAQHGITGDATAFNGKTVEDISRELEAAGLERYGNEVMMHPRTGEQVPCEIFVAPTYYQRLKHMTDDKVHCLTPDHEVLCLSGWKSISEITTNDRVAVMDRDSGSMVYEHPLEVLSFASPMELYDVFDVSSGEVLLSVTPEHRLLVSKGCKDGNKFELVPARDVFESSTTPSKQVYFAKCNAIPDIWSTASNDDWVWLAGLFMAHGRVIDHDAGEVVFTVPGEVHRQDNCLTFDLRGVSGVTVVDVSWSSERDTLTIRARLDPMTEARTVKLAPLFSQTPSLPPWAWRLGRRQALSLFMGITANTGTFVTHCPDLAASLQRLTIHAGMSSWVTPKSESNSKSNTDYEVRAVVTAADLHPMIRLARKETQCETVHCLRVPGEIFCARKVSVGAPVLPVWTGNSRAANGPVVLLTRQPAEGRARDGGLRVGEMEVECLWGHGTADFLKERFMECSDNYRIFACKKCGFMAQVNPEKGIYVCRSCKNILDFAEHRVPYAYKLNLQEIETMGIGMRFIGE